MTTHRSSDDDELERALAAAVAAEAQLRALKASLIPRERAEALNQLMRAELRAMIARETARFQPAMNAAATPDEARAVLAQIADALVAGTERVKNEILSQAQAWTIAALEDRAAEEKEPDE